MLLFERDEMFGTSFGSLSKLEKHGQIRVPDGVHHGEPHVDGEDSMIRSRLQAATDTVITVAQNLDAMLMVFLPDNKEQIK